MEPLSKREKELEYLLKSIDDQIDKLFGKKHDIYEELMEIEKQKIMLQDPNISDGVIDLRCFSNNDKEFYIFLSGTSTEVGKIEYRDYHFGKILGDIGYTIYPDYQGHSYAYQALCLLSDILHKKGIQDFWITTYEDNVASLKTILKYGGMLINKTRDILCYECQTRDLVNKTDFKRG